MLGIGLMGIPLFLKTNDAVDDFVCFMLHAVDLRVAIPFSALPTKLLRASVFAVAKQSDPPAETRSRYFSGSDKPMTVDLC